MVSGLGEGYSDLSPKALSIRLAHFKAQTERNCSPRWRQSLKCLGVGGRFLRTPSHTGNTKQNGQHRVFSEAEFKIKCLGLPLPLHNCAHYTVTPCRLAR